MTSVSAKGHPLSGIAKVQNPFAMTQPVPTPEQARNAACGLRPAASVQPDLRNLHFERLDDAAPRLPTRPGTVILDLEDGVSESGKASRRHAIAQVLSRPLPAGVSVLVRCHGMDDVGGLLLDIEAVCSARLSGFILPMVTRPDEVEVFERLLLERERDLGLDDGHFGIHLLIELPEAYLELEHLVRASPRIRSIMFGKEDFMTRFPMGADKAAELAEARIPLVAAALGVPAIASPYCAVHDPKGFERYCRRTRALGYSGTFSVHPSQRAIADDVFGLSALDLQSARQLIEGSKGGQLVRMNGCMVGPPMRKRAQALLHEAAGAEQRDGDNTSARKNLTVKGPGSEGRFPRYGIDTSTAQIGSILEGPHVYTLDESWRMKWFAHFPTSDAVLTSEPAARALGLEERPLPFSLLLNLCLCLSVEPFSQTCRYHLGLRDARQVAPVRMGDTVRVRIRVEALRNTSAGDAAVIVTTHLLVNQHDQPVFVLTKDSYYAAIPGLEGRPEIGRSGPAHAAFDAALTLGAYETADGDAARASGAFIPPALRVDEGEIILHPAVRPIGWSENLELTTLVRNTHPIHFDAQRHGREGIVVCGGFVQALVQGLASPEFRQVVEERLIHSFHTGTVMPEDRIGALSRVLAVRDAGYGIEEVTVSTLGLLNVDVEQELIGVHIPDALFGPEPVKPAALRALCAAQCPVLENRIALRAIRVLRRLKA